MANQNYTILLVFAALAIAIVIAVVVSQKESFTTNYLKNIAVGNEPATNQVFSMPSYYASLDPRSENQGVSGLRGGGSAPREMMPFSTSGGSMYTAEEMINMGGCADMCDESCPKSSTGYAYLSKDADVAKALNAFKGSGVDMDLQGGLGFENSENTKTIWRKFVDWIRNNAPDYTPPSRGGGNYRAEGGHAIKGMDAEEVKKTNPSLWNNFINWIRENSSDYTPPSRGGGSYRTSSGVDSTNWKDFKDTEQKFGRFSSYQNAVKAEDMLPKPDIAANVDPSQYIVYDRNMGSMMMKSGNRTPVDYIRGDVIPVTSNHTPTISARINDPDSPMFVPRFGSDIGTLQRGYFTNYNDVVQVLEERNASYFMSKAQKDRMDLKANSGMA